MFLSLVRPERISSPITSRAAVTIWFEEGWSDAMMTCMRKGTAGPLPCHCGISCFKSPPGPFRSEPAEREGIRDERAGGRAPDLVCEPADRLRDGAGWDRALALARASGRPRGEPGSPVPVRGRAQPLRPLP